MQPIMDDPLADVREQLGTENLTTPALARELVPVSSDALTLMITRWHADETCYLLMHKGGVCGCRHIAEQALSALGTADAAT